MSFSSVRALLLLHRSSNPPSAWSGGPSLHLPPSFHYFLLGIPESFIGRSGGWVASTLLYLRKSPPGPNKAAASRRGTGRLFHPPRRTLCRISPLLLKARSSLPQRRSRVGHQSTSFPPPQSWLVRQRGANNGSIRLPFSASPDGAVSPADRKPLVEGMDQKDGHWREREERAYARSIYEGRRRMEGLGLTLRHPGLECRRCEMGCEMVQLGRACCFKWRVNWNAPFCSHSSCCCLLAAAFLLSFARRPSND